MTPCSRPDSKGSCGINTMDCGPSGEHGGEHGETARDALRSTRGAVHQSWVGRGNTRAAACGAIGRTDRDGTHRVAPVQSAQPAAEQQGMFRNELSRSFVDRDQLCDPAEYTTAPLSR